MIFLKNTGHVLFIVICIYCLFYDGISCVTENKNAAPRLEKRPMDIDRTGVPKQIFVGSFFGAPGDLLPSSEYPTINQISTSSSIESDATYQELYQKTFNRKQISGLRTPFIPYRSEVWYTLGIKPVHNPFERIKDSLVLVNTFFGLEVPHPLPPLVQEIGTLESIQNEMIDGAIWYSPSLSFNEEPISSTQITFSNKKSLS
ncbi:14221_t:CDS:2, partial [Gigaspora rosea]